MGIAPEPESFSASSELCIAARVMTTRFPNSGDVPRSATLAAHFFQNRLRAGVKQQSGHVLAKSRGLIGSCRRALPNILHAVDRTHARFENEFTAFRARPCAQRHLAAALQRGEQRAL